MSSSQNINSNSYSLLGNKWELQPQDPNLNIIYNILHNRGITDAQDINAYLTPSFKRSFHNPFLMKDMDKAVNRLTTAIKNQERIIIFGDYDVDGISGTAVLYNSLKALNANMSYRLPHRVKDGYGLNIKFIDEFKEKGIKVLITVDCGISCKEQVEAAKKAGIDVIITDHHTIPEQIPDQAYAILHPKQEDCHYPFKGLTGAGVAYKLATALITSLLPSEQRDKLIYSLLDLASLGTVADLGPLLDENRVIVKYGLEAMQNSNWEGLQLLMESAGIDLNQKLGVHDIGFKIGPRINAAGRIDHPYYALQMLLHQGDIEEGKSKALNLERLNQERQEMVKNAILEVEEKVANWPEDHKIFIASSPDWHVGILGLICSRVVEKTNLPTIALQEFDEHLVASFRSTPELNAVEVLNSVKDLLIHYGGHAQAAGFSISKDKYSEFVERVTQFAKDKLNGLENHPTIKIDALLDSKDISDQLMKLISQMEPFGVENEKPIFMLKNIEIVDPKIVGKDQNHLHFLVKTETGNRYSCIAFKLGKLIEQIIHLNHLDIVFSLENNTWKGHQSIQLQVIDIKLSST